MQEKTLSQSIQSDETHGIHLFNCKRTNNYRYTCIYTCIYLYDIWCSSSGQMQSLDLGFVTILITAQQMSEILSLFNYALRSAHIHYEVFVWSYVGACLEIELWLFVKECLKYYYINCDHSSRTDNESIMIK